jgi:hypothetical protein
VLEEQREEELDLAEIRKRQDEPTIPWADVKKDLDL